MKNNPGVSNAETALKTLSLASAVALASSFPSAPVLAQEQQLQLEEIIVTARKRYEPLQEIPVSVTVLSAEELLMSSVRSLRDVQDYAPNVNINKNGGGAGAASISIRGVSYQEVDKSLDPSVGVIMDGVYLGTNVGQLVSNFDIARIEVLRGPQGTLFGKNTTGGVINVVRSQPTGEFGGEVRLGVGSWDLRDFKALVNFPIMKDKLAAKVYAIDTSDDGWLHNTTIDEDTARTDIRNYGFSLLATPTEDFEILFSYDNLKDESDLNGGHNFTPDDSVGCSIFAPLGDLNVIPGLGSDVISTSTVCASLDTGSDEDNVSMNAHQIASVDTDAFTLRAEWSLDSGDITYIGGYRDNDEFRRNEFDASAADYISLDFEQDYEQTSHELNFASSFSDTFDFVIGLYYWDSEYSQRSTTFGTTYNFFIGQRPLDSSSYLEQNQETNSTAAYFQGNWNITEALTATLGVRYTEEEKELRASTATAVLADGTIYTDNGANPPSVSTVAEGDWEETSPKFALSYLLNDDVMLFGSYAEGFKSGGFFGRNTSVDGLTTSYDPEYVATTELGVKSDWVDGRMRFNATVFSTDYDDKQEENLVTTADGNVDTYVSNATTAEIQGAELEFTALLTESIRLHMFYAYLDAEYKDYDADINNDGIITNNDHLLLRRAPENTFGASANYATNFGDNLGFNANVIYRWQDEMETIADNDPLGNVESHGIWNASVDFVYRGNYQLSVYGRNLTDERYTTSVVNIGPLASFGAWNQPLHWGAEFRFKF
ncbi:MAG: TonB-dependent receptor [Halioglobus sp.]